MPRSLLRYRFGIGSVMVAVVLLSAVLSEVIRYPSQRPVAQTVMGGSIAQPNGGDNSFGGGSSIGGGTFAGGSSLPGSNSGDVSGDLGGLGGSSEAASSSAGRFSSFGGLGGDIGIDGGQSSAANNSSAGQQSSPAATQSSSAAPSSSAPPQSSSAAPSSSAPPQSSSAPPSSAPAISSPPPIPSSAPVSSAPPPRCGDGKTDFGETCDPCAPAGRPTTDANCNALCSAARCGDGFTDRRRGEECDYVGLIVDEIQSPFLTRDEHAFSRCVSDSTCGGGYCLYNLCWPLKWLAYWGWADAAVCPQTWSRVTAEGSPVEPIGAPCNDFSNPRCKEFLGDGCTVSCKLERCGDRVVQAGYTTTQGRHYGLTEECDDGNTLPGDGCSDRCTIERLSSRASSAASFAVSSLAFCDQFPHLCAGTSSLPFAFNYSSLPALPPPPPPSVPVTTSSAPPPASSSAAPIVAVRTPTCGDGQIDPGEQCDNGSANSDTVSGACRLQCKNASCGDFVPDYTLGEQCDQGVGNSAVEANRCRPDCRLPRCGDRVVDRNEVCDDGNTQPGDGCTQLCAWETIDAIQPRCGDGRIQGAEQCDDANMIGGDGCSITCQAEFVLGTKEELNPVLVAGGVVCGDGVLMAPEECDDGNPQPNDGCSPLCKKEIPVCGNGVFEAGEQCDDGNALDTDGCNAQCQTVAPPKPAAPVLAQVIPPPPPPISYSYIPIPAPIADTGPAAVAVMASGAAAGVGWLRRRRKAS